MNIKRCIALLVLLVAIGSVSRIAADTYAAFHTTRFYSANRRYFVEVNEKKRATLYRNGEKTERVWSRTLSDLPERLFVTNDGKRCVLVDRYYGNGGSAKTPVIVVLDENGKEIASHRLGELVDVDRTLTTISSSHWSREAKLSPDEQSFLIETQVMRIPWDECRRRFAPANRSHCSEIIPYQQLKFSLDSGALIERVNLPTR